MPNINTNYPWSIVQEGDDIKHLSQVTKEGNVITREYTTHAEDTTIVDADGFEVVGCSEWIRGDENFERIILCVNACAKFTNKQLEMFNLILAQDR